MGGTFVFFIWWFGMKKGCGGAGSSALHVVVNDGPGSCAWQLMNQGSFGGSFGVVRGVVRLYFPHLFSFVFFVCSFFYLLLFLSHRLLLLLFSLFPSFTQSYSFSNQTIVAEWLFVMQSSAGRGVVCSARGGLSRVCYNGTLYPSNEGNPLVFWWIAVTLLWPGRGDFSASGLSTFKKIALTSALDCIYSWLDGLANQRKTGGATAFIERFLFLQKDVQLPPSLHYSSKFHQFCRISIALPEYWTENFANFLKFAILKPFLKHDFFETSPSFLWNLDVSTTFSAARSVLLLKDLEVNRLGDLSRNWAQAVFRVQLGRGVGRWMACQKWWISMDFSSKAMKFHGSMWISTKGNGWGDLPNRCWELRWLTENWPQTSFNHGAMWGRSLNIGRSQS